MKQDYLWDKTGSDPEIESLEGLLSGYGYTGTPAPSIAKEKAVPFFRRLLELRVLIPAGVAAVALLGLGLTFLVRPSPVAEQTAADAPKNIAAPSKEPGQYFPPRVNEPAQKIDTAERPTVVRTAYRTPSKRPTIRRVSPKLTKEEKFAYNQLMLALSITSSKLKIVHDAANGNDNSDSPKSSNR